MANYQSTHTGQEHDAYCTKSQLINLIYPVGAIYISVNSTSPQTLFGGTWQQISDTFLLAAGATYTAGSTGGEATHTLTEAELPVIDTSTLRWHGQEHGTHVHQVNGKWYGTQISNMYQTTGQTTGAVSYSDIGLRFGGGGAHNNMPPYLSVYMWKRTA